MLLSGSALAAWAGYLFWPLVRVMALIGTAPALSHQAIPVRLKVALGVAVALILAPQVAAPAVTGAPLDAGFFTLLVRNILIGASLGFSIRILFAGIELAGQMIGLQIGLSFAGFFNPEAASADNPVANLFSLVALLLFFGIDGHLMMLYGLRQSFEQFPVVGGGAFPITFEALAGLGAQVFSIALSLSLPIFAVILLVNVVLGVAARVAPQIGLHSVGFPITLGIGMLLLMLFAPYLEAPMRAVLEQGFSLWPGG